METLTPKNIVIITGIILVIYLLIKTKITHDEITPENINVELLKLLIFTTFVSISLVLIYYFKQIVLNEDSNIFDQPKIETVIDKEISRISETEFNYHLYFIDKSNIIEEFKHLIIPKNKVDISFSKSFDNTLKVNYKLKLLNGNKVIEDAQNRIMIKTPENYKVESYVYLEDINDLTYKHIKINDCSNQIKYSDNTYSIYIIKDFLMEFKFKEQNGIKLKLIEGNTGKYKACLNLDYYQTLNGEIIKKPDHNPIYEMIISKDFQLD